MQGQDVYDALGSLGPRIGTGVYDQGARRREFGYTDPQVQNGFCHSACLDWARRVVQGGRTSFEPSANDKTGQSRTDQQKRAKVEAQTDRAINMHLNFKLGNINVGSPWQSLRNSLDTGYLGTKKRKFGQIDQIYCEFDLNLGSIRTVVDRLTGTTGFTTNCCALLSFKYTSGGGHVIAVYQTNTSKFVLFDPNYTMFELPNLDKLYDAVRYLFLDAVYPCQNRTWNGKLDMFVYASNVAPSNPAVVVQTISQTHHTPEPTSVITPPMPTVPVPLAVLPTPTIPPSGSTLHPPSGGASQFKQNLWEMLNDPGRNADDYVKIAFSQKKEIEKNGGTVFAFSGGHRVKRANLIAVYNNVT